MLASSSQETRCGTGERLLRSNRRFMGHCNVCFQRMQVLMFAGSRLALQTQLHKERRCLVRGESRNTTRWHQSVSKNIALLFDVSSEILIFLPRNSLSTWRILPFVLKNLSKKDDMAAINPPKHLPPSGDHETDPRESVLATLITSSQPGGTPRRRHPSPACLAETAAGHDHQSPQAALQRASR